MKPLARQEAEKKVTALSRREADTEAVKAELQAILAKRIQEERAESRRIRRERQAAESRRIREEQAAESRRIMEDLYSCFRSKHIMNARDMLIRQ